MAKSKVKIENHYFADFETTTLANYEEDGEVRVFMYGIKNHDGSETYRGTTIQGFMGDIKEISKNRTIYVWFHNLSFDFSYIEDYMLRHDVAMFKPKLKRKDVFSTFGKEYSTVKDEMGNLYSSVLMTGTKSMVTFNDSAKVFPARIKQLGKMLGMPKLDDTFDYKRYIPKYYLPNQTDWEYMWRDIDILRIIMVKQITDSGRVALTRTGYAFRELVDMYKKDNDDRWNELVLRHGEDNIKGLDIFKWDFPATDPSQYREMQLAYSGGIVYINPKHKGKVIEKVISYDVNSEYPGAMLQYHYPIGEPVEFDGNYNKTEKDFKKTHPLFIQRFKAKFTLKEGGFPSLPKKLSPGKRTIYDSTQLDENQLIMLNNTDFKHFLKNYHVTSLIFYGGFAFKSTFAPFASYINAMADMKIKAEKAGDMIMRQMAKLNMNGCYGKFAQSPFRGSKHSVFNESKDVVTFTDVFEDEFEAKQYLPMAIFIAAHARDILLKGIYAAGVDRVLYCDTDSIHLIGHEEPENLDIDPYRLGAWKLEGKHDYGKFLRDKCYVEVKDGVMDIKAAGLTDASKETIDNIDGFELDMEYGENLQKKMVKGGYLLKEVKKTLSDNYDNHQPITLEELEKIS